MQQFKAALGEPDLAPANFFLGVSYAKLHKPDLALAPLGAAITAERGNKRLNLKSPTHGLQPNTTLASDRLRQMPPTSQIDEFIVDAYRVFTTASDPSPKCTALLIEPASMLSFETRILTSYNFVAETHS